MTTFQFLEPLRQVPIFDHEGRKKYLFHSPEIPVYDLHGIVRLPGPESKHISRNDPEKNWHMRVFIDRINAACVKRTGSPHDSVHVIPFGQEQFAQIGAVLASNAGNECLHKILDRNDICRVDFHNMERALEVISTYRFLTSFLLAFIASDLIVGHSSALSLTELKKPGRARRPQ